MKFGKIRIEEGNLLFSSHMIMNSIPCEDIVWAYHRRDSTGAASTVRHLAANDLHLVTRRGRQYSFSMSEMEVGECLKVLKAFNPRMAIGFPRGTRIPLQDLPNTRDLGALKSQSGQHILPRRLIRSGELYHLSAADRRTLTEEYQVRMVIDLRSRKERRIRPDDLPEGASYFEIPLVEDESLGFFQEDSLMGMMGYLEGNPEIQIRDLYVHMVEDPYSVSQLARVLELIRTNQEGAVLWHCSFGKDRTDVVTAVLLYILGIPRERIREDYLRSNDYLEQEKAYAIELMKSRGFEPDTIRSRMEALYEVRDHYLDAAFHSIAKKYGDIDRFLRRGLYLTPKTIDDFKEKYLI